MQRISWEVRCHGYKGDGGELRWLLSDQKHGFFVGNDACYPGKGAPHSQRNAVQLCLLYYVILHHMRPIS
jgi:hypothetical protein